MKTLLLAVFAATLLAISAFAGRVGGYVNAGGYGCGPRYYAPPVCYAPRTYGCYPAANVYYRPAPVYYYSAAPVIYTPAYTPVYRAPIVTSGVHVNTVSFGWHR